MERLSRQLMAEQQESAQLRVRLEHALKQIADAVPPPPVQPPSGATHQEEAAEVGNLRAAAARAHSELLEEQPTDRQLLLE